MKHSIQPKAKDLQQDEEPLADRDCQAPPPAPTGVRPWIVDVIGPYVLQKDRELFERLEQYDRGEEPDALTRRLDYPPHPELHWLSRL